jgi:hypothetical protein
MTRLNLAQAIYGPKPDGSDVSLLARSPGLDDDLLREFANFYYAAWKVSGEERDPFLTFIPLADRHWGLIRSEVLGERSMGVMFLCLMWVLTEQDCEAIGWRSDRLWGELFDQPLQAPAQGTPLPRAVAEAAAPDPALVPGDIGRADGLAHAVHRAVRAGQTIRIGDQLGDLDPGSSLACVLERLGPMAQDFSYCTSARLLGTRYQVLAGGEQRKPIDILASEQPIADPGRVDIAVSGPPPEVWIEDRLTKHGIEPAELRLDRETLEALAGDVLKSMRGAILDRHDFMQIGWMARGDNRGRGKFAAPFLLAETMRRLGNPAAAARALDQFVSEDLDHCQELPSLPRPVLTIMLGAIESGAIFWARPETVNRLGPGELFGKEDSRDEGLGGLVAERLLAFRDTIDAAAVPSLRHLLAVIPGRPALAGLRDQLAALLAAWEGPSEVLATFFAEVDGLAALDRRLRVIEGLLPVPVKARGKAALEALFAERIAHTLAEPSSLEEGLWAVMFGLRAAPQLIAEAR